MGECLLPRHSAGLRYLLGLHDRWLRTGDEVMINEDKELFIVDRLKVSAVFLEVSSLDRLVGNNESQGFPSGTR